MAYEQGYVGDPRGRETAVEDAESYGGGLSLEMCVGPEDEPDQFPTFKPMVKLSSKTCVSTLRQ